MKLSMRRIVIFTAGMAAMTAFYRDIIGLEQIGAEKGWVEFDAGGCTLALHAGGSVVGTKSLKIVFYAKDVAAARAALIARGARLGKVKSGNGLDLCDGRDPDGNRFQISSRP
jgi:catechol 2,3-dioxygenase-like lactoylglutathione lyase family enzyme